MASEMVFVEPDIPKSLPIQLSFNHSQLIFFSLYINSKSLILSR